ncbi:hypothetical protein HY485_01200 [Candidatus Woesearchaeota archaeon]|nr:hypothetical protein [Candidatus Woesearchaeota archaeon]
MPKQKLSDLAGTWILGDREAEEFMKKLRTNWKNFGGHNRGNRLFGSLSGGRKSPQQLKDKARE